MPGRPAATPLPADAIAAARASLPGWSHVRSAGPDGDTEALTKEFVFADFRAALAWMLRAGFEAEALDHHPEWTNVYRTVTVRLNTHSAGGRVTALDLELAARLERLPR